MTLLSWARVDTSAASGSGIAAHSVVRVVPISVYLGEVGDEAAAVVGDERPRDGTVAQRAVATELCRSGSAVEQAVRVRWRPR